MSVTTQNTLGKKAGFTGSEDARNRQDDNTIIRMSRLLGFSHCELGLG